MQFHANKTRKKGGKEAENKFNLQRKEGGMGEDRGKSGEQMRRKRI